MRTNYNLIWPQHYFWNVNKANLNINRFDYTRFQILDKVQGGSTYEVEEEEEEKGFTIIAQSHLSQR